MRTKTFDRQCLVLAEHFLQDHPKLQPHSRELASEIQEAVEAWIETCAEHSKCDTDPVYFTCSKHDAFGMGVCGLCRADGAE
jgi:hypothetical protein